MTFLRFLTTDIFTVLFAAFIVTGAILVPAFLLWFLTNLFTPLSFATAAVIIMGIAGLFLIIRSVRDPGP